MKRFVSALLIAAGVVGAFLAIRVVVAKYVTVATVALAIWNDPEVKKVRRRAGRRLEKAQKAALKAGDH